MGHTNKLEQPGTVLVVIDMQEAFRSAIGDFALIASRISTAVRGFQVLGCPVIVTEQYPRGLGHTAEEIGLVLDESVQVFEKTTFSAGGLEEFTGALRSLDARQIVLCGIETHVCVNQTAHDLLAEGFAVHLLADCVGSRFEHDKQAGLEKMWRSGVAPSSAELALFELMGDSRHAKFKELQDLIK